MHLRLWGIWYGIKNWNKKPIGFISPQCRYVIQNNVKSRKREATLEIKFLLRWKDKSIVLYLLSRKEYWTYTYSYWINDVPSNVLAILMNEFWIFNVNYSVSCCKYNSVTTLVCIAWSPKNNEYEIYFYLLIPEFIHPDSFFNVFLVGLQNTYTIYSFIFEVYVLS